MAVIDAKADRQVEGGFRVRWTIEVLDIAVYDDLSDYARLVVECLWALGLVYFIVAELGELRDEYRATGRLLGYLSDWTNVVDLVSYGSQLGLVANWVRHVHNCGRVTLMRHADVYADFFAVGRILQAGDGLGDFLDMDASLIAVTHSANAYANTVALCIFVCVL